MSEQVYEVSAVTGGGVDSEQVDVVVGAESSVASR